MRKLPILQLFAGLCLLLPFPPVPAREDSERALQALPTPLVQREEVRFVTLDVTGEQKGRGGWHPLRELHREQVTILVAGQAVELELFENHCAEGDPPAIGQPELVASSAAGTEAASEPETDQVRFIIYMDMSRLTLEGWRMSLGALKEWADTSVQPEDPVMIAVAKVGGLRIVRPFLPASQHLHQDIDAAMQVGQADEFWSEWLETRLQSAETDRAVAGLIGGGGSLSALFAEEALHNQRALKNLRDAMTLFSSVEGTKNFIFFQDTFARYSGQMTYLQQIARGANQRNVRVYGVAASGGKVSDAITFLSTETGGRYLEDTNQLGIVLDRAREDSACFFRLGFRMKPNYDGSTKKVVVRVEGESRYRLRHSRSVEDPTLERMDQDMLLAAFLDPAAATAFPLSVELVPLFDHAHGTRIRVQVQVPVSGILSLPVMVGAEELRQMRVQAGASVITLAENDTAELGAQEIGADADENTKLLEFSRQSVLSFPASDAGDAESRYLAFAEELDAPPGDYRLVLVVQDRLARTVAAAVTEFQVAEEGKALGSVRLLLDDPLAVTMMQEKPQRAWHPKPGRLVRVAPSLPDGARVLNAVTLQRGQAGSFLYGLCDNSPAAETGEAGKPFQDWQLHRSLECDAGGDTISLEGGRLPAAGWEQQCILVVNPIPAGSLPPGSCNFQVTLERPGAVTEVQGLALEVAAASNAAAAGTQP